VIGGFRRCPFPEELFPIPDFLDEMKKAFDGIPRNSELFGPLKITKFFSQPL